MAWCARCRRAATHLHLQLGGWFAWRAATWLLGKAADQREAHSLWVLVLAVRLCACSRKRDKQCYSGQSKDCTGAVVRAVCAARHEHACSCPRCARGSWQGQGYSTASPARGVPVIGFAAAAWLQGRQGSSKETVDGKTLNRLLARKAAAVAELVLMVGRASCEGGPQRASCDGRSEALPRGHATQVGR